MYTHAQHMWKVMMEQLSDCKDLDLECGVKCIHTWLGIFSFTPAIPIIYLCEEVNIRGKLD